MADQQWSPRRSPEASEFVALGEIAERSQHMVNEWLRQTGVSEPSATRADPFGFATMFLDMTTRMMTLPASVVSAQMSLWQDYFTLWQNTTNRMLGREVSSLDGRAVPVANEGGLDVDIFTYVKQSYLLTAGWLQQALVGAGLPHTPVHDSIDFFSRQFLSTLTPADFAVTNPEVIRATMETGGENLINGLRNVLRQLEPPRSGLCAQIAGPEGFVLGETVATAPGKVVFRNHLMEVIQYAPTTDRVVRPPLLFVPPWTNKFYLFDLRETNSLVRWATDAGNTVFVISWADPGDDATRASFEDYVLHGPVAALEAIEAATGEPRVNASGFALGGTLLAAALAYLAERGEDRLRSATFLASQLDFSEPGPLGTLIDEATLCHLEEMLDGGEVDARELAETCTLQRETDLLWSFVINNYLLGTDPFPCDLLHWNRDALRLPCAAHGFYLHSIYRKNKLVQPGGLSIGGRPIDLRRTEVPTYLLAAREDHIVPWRSTLRASQLFGRNSRFTLTASGHLAGIVNPPTANRYCFWTNPRPNCEPDEWRSGARAVEGSWWRDWQGWLKQQSGNDTVPAREPGRGGLSALDDAPGEYVRAA